ncbi:Bromodomain-containing protein 7 [Plecturocebus cupreus]
MCTNAMICNKPETVYYKAAKKVSHSGMKILSQERMKSLKQSIDVMADLQKDRHFAAWRGRRPLGERERGLWRCRNTVFKSPSNENKKKDKGTLEDKSKSNHSVREQKQLGRIVRESGGKLTRQL